MKNGAWGFISITNPKNIEEMKQALEQAVKNANYYSQKRKIKTSLIPIKTRKTKKEFPVLKKPQLDDLISIGFGTEDEITETVELVEKLL